MTVQTRGDKGQKSVVAEVSRMKSRLWTGIPTRIFDSTSAAEARG